MASMRQATLYWENSIGTDAAGAAPWGTANMVWQCFLRPQHDWGYRSRGGKRHLGKRGRGAHSGGEWRRQRDSGQIHRHRCHGTAALGNFETGVTIHTGRNNTIGGTEAGARNVISGNDYGILIGDLAATGNRVQGNYIGTDAAGDLAVPNAEMGVLSGVRTIPSEGRNTAQGT